MIGIVGLILTAYTASPNMAGSMRALQGMDQRVLSVGFRLARESDHFCHSGYVRDFAIHALQDYGASARPSAMAAFHFGEAPRISAVASGSPVDLAGLRSGDDVLMLNGHPVKSEAELAGALATIDGSVNLLVGRSGARLRIIAQQAKGCSDHFVVRPSRQINAASDGRSVEITSAMVALARNDAELAAVLAHELAHNLLRHATLNKPSGRREKNLDISRQAELKADRLSLHILDHAGYRPAAALDFWTRFNAGDRLSFLRERTHPPMRTRIAALAREVAAIEASRVKGEKPEPMRPVAGSLATQSSGRLVPSSD